MEAILELALARADLFSGPEPTAIPPPSQGVRLESEWEEEGLQTSRPQEEPPKEEVPAAPEVAPPAPVTIRVNVEELLVPSGEDNQASRVFIFPDEGDFPPAPSFLGGLREYPSQEEARINDLKAKTFTAFLKMCPSFEKLSTSILEEDLKRKTQLNEQIKRRGDAWGQGFLPAQEGDGQAQTTTASEEEKGHEKEKRQEKEPTVQKKRRSLILLARRKSTQLEKLSVIEEKDKHKRRSGVDQKKAKKKSTGGRNGVDDEDCFLAQINCSAVLSKEEVAKYKEILVKRYEKQHEHSGLPPPSIKGTEPPLLPLALAAPFSSQIPHSVPVEPVCPEVDSSSSIPTSAHEFSLPPPIHQEIKPSPTSNSPVITPTGVSSPFATLRSPVLHKAQAEMPSTNRRWSLRGTLQTLRIKKEEEQESFESKYEKNMTTSPFSLIPDQAT